MSNFEMVTTYSEFSVLDIYALHAMPALIKAYTSEPYMPDSLADYIAYSAYVIANAMKVQKDKNTEIKTTKQTYILGENENEKE